MTKHTYTIGRGSGVPLRVPDSERTVSSIHAEVTLSEDGRLFLTDRDSTNGTHVLRNGSWMRLRQDFVRADEPLRLGAYETTLQHLLAGLPERPRPPARKPVAPRPGTAPRRPRRNPETGEIIED